MNELQSSNKPPKVLPLQATPEQRDQLQQLGFTVNSHGAVLFTAGQKISNGYIWRRPSQPDRYQADTYAGGEGPYFDDPIVAAIWIKTELGI